MSPVSVTASGVPENFTILVFSTTGPLFGINSTLIFNVSNIINISEDGWFGNSIGPFQHFAKASYRAIEQNSFLIRSANKGISAIINNKGQVIKKLSSNETGNIELEVPLIVNENKIKNDLIFFVLLITYIFIFNFYKEK